MPTCICRQGIKLGYHSPGTLLLKVCARVCLCVSVCVCACTVTGSPWSRSDCDPPAASAGNPVQSSPLRHLFSFSAFFKQGIPLRPRAPQGSQVLCPVLSRHPSADISPDEGLQVHVSRSCLAIHRCVRITLRSSRLRCSHIPSHPPPQLYRVCFIMHIINIVYIYD